MHFIESSYFWNHNKAFQPTAVSAAPLKTESYVDDDDGTNDIDAVVSLPLQEACLKKEKEEEEEKKKEAAA